MRKSRFSETEIIYAVKQVAELGLDKEILQDVLRKNSEACTQAGLAL
jgi:hypothetical protein